MAPVAAVDVGTASARAGIFDAAGRLLGRAERPIARRQPAPGWAEHDSTDLWAAASAALRAARAEAGMPAEAVLGLGFDATCSLVLRDRAGRPLALDGAGWDTLSWSDHRAQADAAEITAGGGALVAQSGGAMSPEMQLPKLLWLKRNRPDLWARTGHLFDLADFLTWQATGSTARSDCTLGCKWGYRPEAGAWPDDTLARFGLADLRTRGALPDRATPIGSAIGRLTETAAAELGLAPGTPVAAGFVDAHAGALGVLGGLAGDPAALERRPALIGGTSSCLMALSRRPRTVPGLWGPYHGVVLPGLWMNEGGQSASGALLDHVLAMHAAGGAPSPALHARVLARIEALRAAEGPEIAPRLHLLPDFHGNRSPLADPRALGAVTGLDLDRSFDGLARLYWRTAVALALGLRQVLERMEEAGPPAEALHIAGGHARNRLLVALYADATGRPVVVPDTPDAVLLGSGMLAAAASGIAPDLAAAARAMAPGTSQRPPDPAARARLDRDYRVFLLLQRHRQEIEAALAD